MKTMRHRLGFGAALLAGLVALPATGWSQPHFGGGGAGGGHAGGGLHLGGGGGHVGGAAHFAGGGHAGGYSPHFAAPRYAGGVHGGGVVSAGHYAGAGHPAQGRWYTPRPAYAGGGWARSSYYGGGWGPGWYGHPYWGGGYWGGAWWPRVWYGGDFAWFLPVLPVGAAVYWWSGLPYYYWNNVYYAWSAPDNGYVVTDPPPVAGDANAEGAAAEGGDSHGVYSGAQASGSADIYVYPRNGQGEEQTANDRYECHRWSVDQSGFDPTRSQNSGTAVDYRRALIACLDGRGYSAR